MKPVFLDIDTQLDFLYPAGALYVRGAERIVPAIAQLNRYAAAHGIPVVSTTDAHAEDDPEFRVWPPHCVLGTAGQAKASATLLESRVVVPNRRGTPSIAGAQQIVAQKQTTDVMLSDAVREVLRALDAERYVVYGVVTEICVATAALGVLKLGKPVSVVSDAVEKLSDEKATEFFQNFTAAGGRVVSVAEVTAG